MPVSQNTTALNACTHNKPYVKYRFYRYVAVDATGRNPAGLAERRPIRKARNLLRPIELPVTSRKDSTSQELDEGIR